MKILVMAISFLCLPARIKLALLSLLIVLLAGCEGYYYADIPAYAPIEQYHAGYIMPPLGGGRPVGGAIYSGYGNNIMVTPPLGGPVGSTMVSGY